MNQKPICILCGSDEGINDCHIKAKATFSDGDKISGEDRYMNIITLCEKHHTRGDWNLDTKKNLVIADLGADKDLVFVRWKHCKKGYCISQPKEPIRVLSYIKWGGPGDTIKPEYIKMKNKEAMVSQLIDFTSKIPPKYKYKNCEKESD